MPKSPDMPLEVSLVYRDAVQVARFMRDEVLPLMQSKQLRPEPADTVYGLFVRAVAWVATFEATILSAGGAESVERSSAPFHWQAHSAGARSLFELAIDLTLLVRDPANFTSAMIHAWERSAHLDSAEANAKVRTRDPDLVAIARIAKAFVRREGKRIERERQVVWPPKPGKTRSHPQRWTNMTLFAAAQRATKLFPPGAFVRFYRQHNAQLCWGTHGSTLVGLRTLGTDDAAKLSGLAAGLATELAVICVRMALDGLGLFTAPRRRDLQTFPSRIRIASHAAFLAEIAR